MTISGGLDRFANNPSTDLNGAITSTQPTITVDSILGFPNPGPYRILIDNEQMQVVGGYNTTTATVIRGVEGTAQATHADEAAVVNNITAFDFNSFRQEFNVIAYGAVGNGTADDSNAFQNAINDAHALTNGGHVFLPDLAFNILSTLSTYANVVFVTYGAVLSGAGASSVTPLIRWSQSGGLTLPAALTVASGGALITGNSTVTGNLTVTGTTILGGVAYTWPANAGTTGQVLATDGIGTLSWATNGGGVTAINGTANQITVTIPPGSPNTRNISLPSGGTLPGAWTSAQGLAITTGGLTVSAGGIAVSGGGINVTGGITGTIATAAQPNITSLGTLNGLNLFVNRGILFNLTQGYIQAYPGSGSVTTLTLKTALPIVGGPLGAYERAPFNGPSAGWISVTIDGTAAYVPYWT